MKTRYFFILLLLLSGQSLAAQSIALISDLNGRYGNTSYDDRVGDAIGSIVRMQPDLVISTGDMVAGQKQPKLDQQWLDSMWRGFNRVVTDPLAKAGIPFVVTAGNHDGSGFPKFALERERFEAQWLAHVPELEILPGSEWPRRYAARLGEVLLLTFDGTRPGELPETERAFISLMLQTYSDPTGVTLVFSHLPMWPLSKGRESEILDDPALLTLLHQFGVDAFISGHHHVYFPGVDSAGMLHLGVGALGGNARTSVGRQVRQPFSFAVLELAEGLITVRSLAAPDFSAEVSADLLPAAVEGPLGTLRRLDGPIALHREVSAFLPEHQSTYH